MEASRGRPRKHGFFAFAPSVAFAVWLVLRGVTVRASLVLAALGALGCIVAAAAMRGTPALASLPETASTAFAWGVGSTLAFGGALRALQHDREQGVLALARTRGVGAAAYVGGRVSGLALVLLVAVGGGTLIAGFAATAAAGALAPAAARTTVAALVYSVAFAVTVAPVAVASLGGPSRSGGYAWLLAVLVVPELLAPWTRDLLPRGWHELTSIPAALEAVRAGAQTSGAAVHAARAAVGLVAVVAASLLVIRARMLVAGAAEDA